MPRNRQTAVRVSDRCRYLNPADGGVGWLIELAALVILVLVILMLMNKRVVAHWLSNGVKHTEGPILSGEWYVRIGY